jgi:hypothetical protein
MNKKIQEIFKTSHYLLVKFETKSFINILDDKMDVNY